MAEGYSILVDTSKCTACRGCQIACKQWNQLPGTQTKNVGSYENPTGPLVRHLQSGAIR